MNSADRIFGMQLASWGWGCRVNHHDVVAGHLHIDAVGRIYTKAGVLFGEPTQIATLQELAEIAIEGKLATLQTHDGVTIELRASAEDTYRLCEFLTSVKACPFCTYVIEAAARVCRICGSNLEAPSKEEEAEEEAEAVGSGLGEEDRAAARDHIDAAIQTALYSGGVIGLYAPAAYEALGESGNLVLLLDSVKSRGAACLQAGGRFPRELVEHLRASGWRRDTHSAGIQAAIRAVGRVPAAATFQDSVYSEPQTLDSQDCRRALTDAVIDALLALGVLPVRVTLEHTGSPEDVAEALSDAERTFGQDLVTRVVEAIDFDDHRERLASLNVYFAPEIPIAKLGNAIDKYAERALDEEHFVLYDSTVFGGARDGFLLTTRALYGHDFMGEVKEMPLSAIENLEIQKDKLEVNGSHFATLTLESEDAGVVKDLLCAIMAHLAKQH